MNNQKTTRRSISVFHQLVQWVPEGLIEKLGRHYKIDARRFSVTSHVFSLMLGHFIHAFSLNEICDALQLHGKELCRTRNITAPRRNTFSNANRTRNPKLAEELYWSLFSHFQRVSKSFGNAKLKGVLSKFRLRKIYAIDSTIILLSLKCIDWAKHRRKKAAIKTHMRTDVANMLPRFAIVENAAHHDSQRASALCEGLTNGDILLADRAYVDFNFLWDLTQREIFYVVRQKQKMRYEVIQRGNVSDVVLADEIIILKGVNTTRTYPNSLRRIEIIVEVDGQMRPMTFLTNNMTWKPSTIAELYKARWTIELLFKELKQTLQLQTFYGENETAVKWQIWTALIVHLILRFMQHISRWKSSYSRLVGIVRAAMWMKIDLLQTLISYGTAPPSNTIKPNVVYLVLPGFEKYFR